MDMDKNKRDLKVRPMHPSLARHIQDVMMGCYRGVDLYRIHKILIAHALMLQGVPEESMCECFLVGLFNTTYPFEGASLQAILEEETKKNSEFSSDITEDTLVFYLVKVLTFSSHAPQAHFLITLLDAYDPNDPGLILAVAPETSGIYTEKSLHQFSFDLEALIAEPKRYTIPERIYNRIWRWFSAK